MPSFAASRSTTSYARGSCSRVTGCARYIFSAILSEKKYAVKFITTEMTNARIRPFWPPKRSPTASRTSIRVTSKSVDLKVFMVYQPVRHPAVCCGRYAQSATRSAIGRGRSGFDAAEGPAQNHVKRCFVFSILCVRQLAQDAIALEFKEFILQRRQQRALRWGSNRERRLGILNRGGDWIQRWRFREGHGSGCRRAALQHDGCATNQNQSEAGEDPPLVLRPRVVLVAGVDRRAEAAAGTRAGLGSRGAVAGLVATAAALALGVVLRQLAGTQNRELHRLRDRRFMVVEALCIHVGVDGLKGARGLELHEIGRAH